MESSEYSYSALLVAPHPVCQLTLTANSSKTDQFKIIIGYRSLESLTQTAKQDFSRCQHYFLESSSSANIEFESSVDDDYIENIIVSDILLADTNLPLPINFTDWVDEASLEFIFHKLDPIIAPKEIVITFYTDTF